MVALAFLPFLVLAPDGVAHSLGRQLVAAAADREPRLGAAARAHHLVGLDARDAARATARRTCTRRAPAVAAVAAQPRSQVGGARLDLGALRPRAGEPSGSSATRAAAVVAFVAFGKVLSPQFLIWLVPLVPARRAAVAGSRASALLAVALVLTQLWFPYRYWDFVREFDPLPSCARARPRPRARRRCSSLLVWRAQGHRDAHAARSP